MNEFERRLSETIGTLESKGFQISYLDDVGNSLTALRVSKGNKNMTVRVTESATYAEAVNEDTGEIREIRKESVIEALTEEIFESLNDFSVPFIEDDEDFAADETYEKPKSFNEIDLSTSNFPLRDEVLNAIASFGLDTSDVYFYSAGKKHANMVFDGSPLVPILDYDFDDGRVPFGWGVAESDQLIEAIDTAARKNGYQGFEQVNNVTAVFVK